jgi:hypothetical protein
MGATHAAQIAPRHGAQATLDRVEGPVGRTPSAGRAARPLCRAPRRATMDEQQTPRATRAGAGHALALP